MIFDVPTDDLDELCHIQITSNHLLQVFLLTLRRFVNQLKSIAKHRQSFSSLQEQLQLPSPTSTSLSSHRNLPTQLKLSGVLQINKHAKTCNKSSKNWKKHFSVLSQRELKSF
jgi:hypothetical protein